MVEVPLISYPSRSFQIILDEQDCSLKLYQKGRVLYLDLSVNASPVTAGNICLNKTSIILHSQRLFTGHLFFLDTVGDSHPQWDGLGSRWVLLFANKNEELPAFVGTY